MSEAGKLGAIASREFHIERNKERRKEAIEEWEAKNIKCPNCLKPIEWSKTKKKFCDQSCAASYNNKKFPKREKQNILTDRTCTICNNQLNKFQKKYCSKICCGNAPTGIKFIPNAKKTKIPKNISCRHCNKLLLKSQKYLQYCSKKCYHDDVWNNKKNLIEKTGSFEHISLNPLAIKKFLTEKFSHKCSICEISEWLGQKILLIMDHINGDSTNNSVENLRLICSNCDMQLPTYKGANKGKGRKKRVKRYHAGKSY